MHHETLKLLVVLSVVVLLLFLAVTSKYKGFRPLRALIRFLRGLKWHGEKRPDLVPELSCCLLYGDAKGVLLGRRIGIVCSHANPRKGTEIGIRLPDGTWEKRKIADLRRVEIPERMVSDAPVVGPSGKFIPLLARDVTVVLADRPFEHHKEAKLASDPKTGRWCLTVEKEGTYSLGRLRKHGYALARFDVDDKLEPGDSGGPWFVQEGGELRAISHTALGGPGIGLNYALMRPLIGAAVADLVSGDED